MCRGIEGSDDIARMTDKELVEYTTEQQNVTPLENELAHRLENYVAIYGDERAGDAEWE